MESIANNPSRIMLFLAIALLVLAVLAALSPVVKLVITSALLAYVLIPVARFLESRMMSWTAATTTIFIAIVVFIIVVAVVFLPMMLDEVGILKDGITSEKTSLMLTKLENALTAHFSFLGVRDLDLPSRVQHTMVGVGSWLFNHLFDAASAITSMILIPFIVFFLMKDGRAFKRALISLVPNRYFEFTLYLLYKLNIQFGNYLRGQLLDSLIVGTLATAALWALDVKYAFIIGVFTGLANIIPYVGPITGAALAIIISMLQTGSLEKVLSLIAAFAVIKLIDDVLVQPLIVARSVQMHPLTVLLAVLAGGQLYGVLGMLLSVPIAGFIKVVVKESVTNYRKYGEV